MFCSHLWQLSPITPHEIPAHDTLINVFTYLACLDIWCHGIYNASLYGDWRKKSTFNYFILLIKS